MNRREEIIDDIEQANFYIESILQRRNEIIQEKEKTNKAYENKINELKSKIHKYTLLKHAFNAKVKTSLDLNEGKLKEVQLIKEEAEQKLSELNEVFL